jgi:hypothetical protein
VKKSGIFVNFISTPGCLKNGQRVRKTLLIHIIRIFVAVMVSKLLSIPTGEKSVVCSDFPSSEEKRHGRDSWLDSLEKDYT